MKNINRFSLFSQPIFFSNFFTPALKGEVAENQAPFRVGVKLIFSIVSFRNGLLFGYSTAIYGLNLTKVALS